MAIHFNHTILSAHDSKASVIFLAEDSSNDKPSSD
jgi:hypothetical protein